MKTNTVPRLRTKAATATMTLALGLLCAGLPGSLKAQAPCLGVETFATGLLAPSKIIQSPRGNFLVAEGGPEVAKSVAILRYTGCQPDRAGGLSYRPDQLVARPKK